MFLILLVIDNTRQIHCKLTSKRIICNNWYYTNVIHWKISINLFINSQKHLQGTLKFLGDIDLNAEVLMQLNKVKL